MQDTFEEIRRQIHEIRNFLAPFDLKLAIVEERIAQHWALFEQRFDRVESKLLKSSFTIEALLERVGWIESALNVPPRPQRADPMPAREDKLSPEILPPQKPGP